LVDETVEQSEPSVDEDPLDDSAEEAAFFAEPVVVENIFDGLEKKGPVDRRLSVTISQFTEAAFRMPREDGLPGFKNFSFEGRRHLRMPYDTSSRRILLCTGRQVEKSTLLGNRAIAYCCLVPSFKVLYVSPTSTQTKTFSTDRLKEPIETSDILRGFTNRALSQNVFEKQFSNWSKITLRNAFLNADRTRGIPAWMLLLDEFQDILSDNVPVIEQCTGHAPKRWRQFVYAGTPKSLDNNIEYYRAQQSTQGEWMVPCDHHGGEGGRYWNILGERNIGRTSLICEKCGGQIYAQHPDAVWAGQVENAPFESYRIPQLMVPWKPWEEILLDYERYPRDKFYNEVLGLSYDSGMRPLTMAQVQACCRSDITMHPDTLEKYKEKAVDNPVFAGLDWGTGENTYTVLTLGTYVNMKFRVIYMHRFTGVELDPQLQLRTLDEILNDFRVLIIGADYGGGFDRNDHLTRKFGPNRLAKFQYMARAKRKVEFDAKLRRYKVFRTEVMSDIFNAIKRSNVFEFPRWEEFKQPFAQDMCNIHSEYNETLRMIQYDHGPDRPDDSFHSLLYCFLASCIKFPRPDIIAPLREDQNRGPMMSVYSGPVNQG